MFTLLVTDPNTFPSNFNDITINLYQKVFEDLAHHHDPKPYRNLGLVHTLI